MIRSMTGYGKSVLETPQKKISVEIRSLNSKQADLNTRVPWLYKEKEIEIRNLLSKKLERGKIDLFISFDIMDDELMPVINKASVKNYYRQLSEVSSELGIDPGVEALSIIMRLPEALKSEKPELTDEEWKMALKMIDDALKLVDNYRIEEGKALAKDLSASVNKILGFLKDIAPYEAERIAKVREKLTASLNDTIGSENVDMNRFEQEIIFYLEKLDINEEKVRLRKHCDYFIETMNGKDSNGKMLSFIAQEMGREINTIGSKANDASIQKIVVMMKDELEKIKEQVLNVL
ncbi:MAG TPA: YicC family protein [Bacteroidales bacterium]|nr:YicC family protein [Bacteroidales bacterium]